MPVRFGILLALIMAVGAIIASSGSVLVSQVPASQTSVATLTPAFDATRMAQPATVVPPAQSENGAQIYWGMCSACHGDRGQGLTEEWRNAYSPSERDCWQSTCHGEFLPENSFEIPQTGAPAIVGSGILIRFSNAFELQSFIYDYMPRFPTGSLTSEEALSLTAFVLGQNGKQPEGLVLSRKNSAAIPIHHPVVVPKSVLPEIFLLAGILSLASVLLAVYARQTHGVSIVKTARPNFFLHLHPPSIPAEQARFRYTLGAGGLALFLMLVLFITGLLEMYYYIPTAEQAAISVETITTLVPFGSLVRNLHFWSAQFLVIVVTLHLLRVVLTGAYAPPRHFNYLLGLVLLVLVLLLDFTGYMLRWDEGIRWALVVGTNLLKTIPVIGEGVYEFLIGGSEPGTATVTRFYTWHIFGLGLIAGIFLVWHIFRVRRDGGIAVPPPGQRQENTRITRLELFRREVLAITIASVVLLLFSLIVPAPIGQPISDTQVLTSDSRAPWFFLWIQQLLKVGNPFIWGVLIPVMVIVVLGILPSVLPNVKITELGRWFPNGNRLAQVLAVLIIFLILFLTLLGAFSGLRLP